LSIVIGASISAFAFVVLVFPIAIGVVYSVKFSKRLPRLKQVMGAKNAMVAFSWSFSGTFLPLSSQGADISRIALVFTYIFIQVIVNTILFDFLDMKGDCGSGIKTLPIILGRKRTKKLLIAVNSLLCIWLAFCGLEGFFLNYLPALAFGAFYGYVIIWYFLRENAQRLKAELMVDGQWIPIIALMRIAFIR
jgi:4-hydroxybenzoate polyprenyltransferase